MQFSCSIYSEFLGYLYFSFLYRDYTTRQVFYNLVLKGDVDACTTQLHGYCALELLRYDLIDRPGVLGNYVPVNYHSLYDLSVLVEGF